MPNIMVVISFFAYLLFISEVIVSKKIQLPDLDSLQTEPQGECSRCKALADSFNYWLDKTSRGKYEGGDAAWEETKLKSYSRSEIRLVEIQESLCSELKQKKDQCYILAEDVEQVLEKWWFNEDPESTNLYDWLCIETLKYCCPAQHYGDECHPCPKNKDNIICSGHGKCNGEGTRKGNGTCICKKGYTGTNCEECANNYFWKSDTCKPCHKTCNGCSDEGANACLTCKDGWELKSGECVDINECLTSIKCNDNQYCINQEGSYICRYCDMSCASCAGEGPTNCTGCELGYILWSGVCLNEQQRTDVLTTTCYRLEIYSILIAVAIFTFRTSKLLASVIILLVVIFVYFTEKESNMHFIDVLYNLYFVG